MTNNAGFKLINDEEEESIEMEFDPIGGGFNTITEEVRKSSWDQLGDELIDDGGEALDEFNTEGAQEIKEFLADQTAANFNWYQPHATSSGAYAGVRRYMKGDKVAAYSVAMQKDENSNFIATPQGGIQELAGAKMALIASLVSLGCATLAF